MKIKIHHIRNLIVGLLIGFALTATNAQELKKEVQFVQHKMIPFYNLKKAGNTTIFQGNRKKSEYFEGWYFKMVSEKGEAILSVIPGISLSNNVSEHHAFIQLINGVSAQTKYYSFPIEAFSFSKKEFAIKIGNNYFSKDRIILDLKDSDFFVSGEVEMLNLVDYESGRMMNSGIMGWYRFVPFMECYHGVVSLTHNLKGKMNINNQIYNFDNGRGYIEKDWGSSMPSSWIWLQTNHFKGSNSSLMLSIADIPWLGKSFTGFLGFFYHNNKIHHFATYRSTKLHLEIINSNVLEIKIENRKNTFILNALSNNTGMLQAPTEGAMDRRIPESIDAKLKITMLDKKGNIVFVDSANITGLEMVGDYKQLQGLLK